jgi:hypothetical protein
MTKSIQQDKPYDMDQGKEIGISPGQVRTNFWDVISIIW